MVIYILLPILKSVEFSLLRWQMLLINKWKCNHRIIWVVRDLEDDLVATSLSQTGSSKPNPTQP